MEIVSVYNHKGGVTKTETAKQLTDALLLGGKSVLVIDLDPQANLASDRFGISSDIEGVDTLLTGRQDIDNFFYEIESYKVHFENTQFKPSLYVMPPGPNISNQQMKLTTNDFHIIALTLLQNLKTNPVFSKFDYCIIDNPPSADFLTGALLPLVDKVITPYKVDGGSANSALRTHSIVKNAKKRSKTNRIVFVPSLVRIRKYKLDDNGYKQPIPTKLCQTWMDSVMEYVENSNDARLRHTKKMIIDDESIPRAYQEKKIIFLSKSSSPFARQFSELLFELLPELIPTREALIEFSTNIQEVRDAHKNKFKFKPLKKEVEA